MSGAGLGETRDLPAGAGSGPGRRRLAVLVLLAAAAAGALTGWTASSLRGDNGRQSTAAESQTATGTIPLESVTSLDPSGGSGLRRDGERWQTQTYTSAEFGNLKEGVGLVLDLGSARPVTDVTVDVATTPLVIELRAADQEPTSLGSFQTIGQARSVDATGATALTASGAEHRYWLVWVTQLAPDGGGYRAAIGTPTVRGPSG